MLKKSTLSVFLITGTILSSFSSLALNSALAAPTNLIKNPSVETGAALPDFWHTGKWGTNTTVFTYPASGIDGARAMRIDMSAFSGGDAKWYFDNVPVRSGTDYAFSDSYQSDVDTEAVIRYQTASGTTKYVFLGTVPASATPTTKSFAFTTPSDAVSLTVFHLIAKNGYLVVDNYSLRESGTPPPPPPPSSNLIANGSFETAGTAGNPANWARGGWGTNTAIFTYPSLGADGNKAAKIEIIAYTNGDAKWYFPEVPVTAGATYTFSDSYKASAATELVIQYKIGTSFSYQFLASLPASGSWTTATKNITIPAGATTLSVFHLLSSVGTLETDAFSLVSNTTPSDTTLPTASITAPTAGAILSGTTTISVTANDNVAVAGVTLLVDGAVVGTEDTAAPYDFSLNTTVFSNASHTLTARARDTSGNLGTSAGVTVTISNGPPVTPGFQTETVASDLILPTAMAFAPDGRIFIAEKGGAVRVVKNGALLLTRVITLSDINSYGDRGLIGIATDPNFITNGYLYLSYTYENTPGANFSGPKTVHIARVTVVGDVADESSKVILVGTVDGDATNPSCENFLVTADCIPSDSSSHSAGGLRFGPDGKLYATLGEGASFDRVDTRALRAQSLDSLGGKLLRINSDGTAPADNPFYNGDPNANRSKVYAYGMRNAFRFNFRPSDGALFLGDVGWDKWEEINLIQPGKNYGWPCREATSNSTPASGGPGYVCDAPGATDPLYFYQHDSAGAGSVTAGAFPTGSAYPAEFSNSFFFGDYAQNFIKRLVLDGNNAVLSVQQDVIDNPGGPVDLSTGPDGNMYYLAIYTGELKRLVYTTGNRNPIASIGVSPSAGMTPLSVNFSSIGSSDPNGDTLSYSWNFGDGTTSNLPNPAHTYTANGIYNAVLTLSDSRGGVDIKSVTITAGNQPPQANITNPASGSLYKVGDTITLQGQGTDPENGTLPPSAYHWRIILHHNIHTHLLQEFFGTTNPSFTAPDHGIETDVYTEVLLTVTDSVGLAGTRSINLYLDNGTGNSSGNLIKNASMEMVDPNDGGSPLSWAGNFYGNNNTVFTYPVPGFDGSSAGKVQITGYVNGGAHWHFDPVYITPGENYNFSDYYTSNTNSSLTAEFGFADGTYQYVDLATLPPTTTPTRVERTITIPANVQRLSVTHELAGNGVLTTDNFSLTLGGTPPPDTTLPTASITAPIANATVSGTTNIEVTANDNIAVAGVTLLVDGVVVGVEDTTAPYIFALNTTTLSNSSHTLTARARDTANNTVTSAGVVVTINNAPISSSNLIANGSFETTGANNDPAGWFRGGWGTRTAIYTYPTPGVDGTNAVKVEITSSGTYGDAEWYFQPIPITGGSTFTFSDKYKSNVETKIYVRYTNSGGFINQELGTLPPSSAWVGVSFNTVAPDWATDVIILHVVPTAGWLEVDAYSLVSNTTAPDTTLPTASITAPTAGATVSGTTNVAVVANDNIAIAGVTLLVDGVVVGTEDTTTPYSFVWNTASVPNASHTLTARARDTSNNLYTSSPVSVTANNDTTTPATNLITNGSFETAGTGGNPLGWMRGGWGDQTAVFTYPITGFDGGKAVGLQITSYPATGGDSKWVFDEVLVTPGKLYTYSERYQANTISDVIGQYTMNDNSLLYFGLTKELPPTTGWTFNTGSFCPPIGTKSVTLFHLLSTITTLSLDDVSLTAGGSCTPAETVPPTVAFTNPLEGNTVSGTVALNATATDNVGVTQFFFAVDGDPFGPNMPTGPYTINWDSTTVPNGAHTLKATATDAAGNNERQIINVIVNN